MVASASLASNTTCMAALKDAGGVSLFFLLLHSPSLLEVELAAAALCNIVAALDPAVEGAASKLEHSASLKINCDYVFRDRFERPRCSKVDEFGT
jgi:hypothetical protein